MNPGKSNSRINFCIILLLLIPFNILSQANTINSLPKADTSSNNESGGSHHSFFTGIGSGSNMIYIGSTISGNQPYGYTSLTYGYNSSFLQRLQQFTSPKKILTLLFILVHLITIMYLIHGWIYHQVFTGIRLLTLLLTLFSAISHMGI